MPPTDEESFLSYVRCIASFSDQFEAVDQALEDKELVLKANCAYNLPSSQPEIPPVWSAGWVCPFVDYLTQSQRQYEACAEGMRAAGCRVTGKQVKGKWQGMILLFNSKAGWEDCWLNSKLASYTDCYGEENWETQPYLLLDIVVDIVRRFPGAESGEIEATTKRAFPEADFTLDHLLNSVSFEKKGHSYHVKALPPKRVQTNEMWDGSQEWLPTDHGVRYPDLLKTKANRQYRQSDCNQR